MALQSATSVWVALMLSPCLSSAQTTAGSSVETIRALIDKGNSLMSHGAYAQAIEQYAKVLEIEANNPFAKSNIVLAHNNWGISYFHKGQYDLAKQEWDTALKLDAGDRNAKNNLAVLKRTLERQGKSFDDLKVGDKKPDDTSKDVAKQAATTPSSAVVILSAPQKQPVSGNYDAASEKPASENTIADYGGEGFKAEAAPAPVEAVAVPAKKSKADEELEAFRRLTSSGGGKAPALDAGARSAIAGQSQSASEATGGLTFRSSARLRTDNGEVATFMDDRSGSRANTESASTSGAAAVAVLSEDGATKPSRHHHPKGQAQADSPAVSAPADAPLEPGSIDSILNRLEVKIYGQATAEASVIKRLEKMETDSFGRASVGAIAVRLARLKKMYNIQD